MEHELRKVLDGVDEPVTVEGLEEVVRRAGQRRRASLVAGAAGLLALGALTGALARGPVRERSTGLAAEQPAPAPVPGTSMASPVLGDLQEGPDRELTSLFRREANGVAIRAYRMQPYAKEQVTDPKCAPPPLVEVQVSNAAAVSVGGAAEVAGDEPAVLGVGEFGHREGEAATWVIVRPGKGSATVRLRSGTATDTMAPQQGVAVLAVAGSASRGGTVEALGADGAVLTSLPLNDPVRAFVDPSCFPRPCPVPPDGPQAGVATTVPDPMPPPPAEPVPTPRPTPALTRPVTDLPADEAAALAERRKLREPFVTEGAAACGWAGPPEGAASPPVPAPVPPVTASDQPAPAGVERRAVPPTSALAPRPAGARTPPTTAPPPPSTASSVPAS